MAAPVPTEHRVHAKNPVKLEQPAKQVVRRFSLLELLLQ